MCQNICYTGGYKNIEKVLFVFVLFILSFEINGQTNKKVEDLYTEAQKQFSTKNYSGTIKICNQILSEEPKFKDAHLLLADVYNKLDSVNSEIAHLNKAGEIGREWDVVFRLGEAHFKKADYFEALRYYNIYSDYKYIPEKRQFLLACKIASCKFAIQPLYNSEEIALQKSGISTTGEYWPTISADGKMLVFTRISNNSKPLADQVVEITQPDSAKWDIAGLLNDTIAFYNEGVKILSDSSKIIFFTACNRPDGMGNCDIYFARFKDGKWNVPVNAGSKVNSEYREGQPTFSAESNVLYFSGDKTGGKGKSDIWKCELTGFSEDGLPQWKQPVNLGNLINTSGNEISPVIFENKHLLYFASDGHPGIGGMDLYSAETDKVGNVTNLRNLGYPINTHYNDAGLTLSYVCDTTYFTSSRMTETGEEIFAFNLDRGLATTPVAYVKVKVSDLITKKPVLTAVKLENQPFKTSRFQIQDTDENGETMFCVQLNRNYAFTISEPGYLFVSRFLNQGKVNSISEPQILNIELEPIEIGAEVQLYNIYYETDSFRILPQSETELQNVVSFLENNSELKIEIQGHTDSSGNAESNQILSQRRAKSVVDYLTRNGINTNRLKFGGYGDKVPISSNETAEGRMLNRRTTIRILEK
jgi:outer membrane protein OmpA-like peptidoglycan-associated protein/Tol biopolymer transport system component